MKSTRPDTFISHAAVDKDWAMQICAHLERHGLVCWVAPRDIPQGERWPVAIADGIERSAMVLFLLSAASNASNQVEEELLDARAQVKPILTAVLDQTAPSPVVEKFIRNRQFITVAGRAKGDVLDDVLHACCEILGHGATSETVPPPVPLTHVHTPRREGRASGDGMALAFRWAVLLLAAACVVGLVVTLARVGSGGQGGGLTEKPPAPDTGESLADLKRAADSGSLEAQKELASRYANGTGVEQSLIESAKWLAKAVAQGDLESMSHLGTFYLQGLGVEQSTEMAVYWLQRAAAGGYAPCEAQLGGHEEPRATGGRHLGAYTADADAEDDWYERTRGADLRA